MYKIILLILSFTFLSDEAFAQNRNRGKKKELLRQYTFSALSVADSKSDSIRILSYLVVPNKVLKFVKKSDAFESSYQAKITIKKKKGNQ